MQHETDENVETAYPRLVGRHASTGSEDIPLVDDYASPLQPPRKTLGSSNEAFPIFKLLLAKCVWILQTVLNEVKSLPD